MGSWAEHKGKGLFITIVKEPISSMLIVSHDRCRFYRRKPRYSYEFAQQTFDSKSIGQLLKANLENLLGLAILLIADIIADSTNKNPANSMINSFIKLKFRVVGSR